jgi:hypothetical protein
MNTIGRTTVVSAVLLCAIRAGGSQELFEDAFPPGFAFSPGAAPPVPAHVAAALEDLAPGPSYVLATNVLSLSARYVQAPLPGRAARVEIVYSNLTDGAFHVFGVDDAAGPRGVRYFALDPGGSRRLLRDDPRDAMTYAPRLEPGGRETRILRMSPALVDAVAGSEGVAVAYAGRLLSGLLVYAESSPLAVPAAPGGPTPPPLTPDEWRTVLTNWVNAGAAPDPYKLLDDYPDAAPHFPGVVLDAALPEAFRVEFAEWMPDVDGWDPGVLAAVTNAPDKDAPLVLAMLNVLRRSGGPSPEERAARRAVNQTLYAMSQDAQLPLLFRLHAAHTFPMHIAIDEFNLRTESHFKMLAADEVRGHMAGDYYEADRVQLRAGLTAMSTDTTPFVAGPLAGKYPENATVGQVASIILADLEAKWAAEPPRQE